MSTPASQLADGDGRRVAACLLGGGVQMSQLGVDEAIRIDSRCCGVVDRETLNELF